MLVWGQSFQRSLQLLVAFFLKDIGVKQLNISNIAARQELRDMMRELNLPGVEVDF